MRPELADRANVTDPRLRDHHRILRCELRQLLGAGQVNGQVVQVAVVHAEDLRAESPRALRLLLIDHLGEYVHAKGACKGGEAPVLLIVQHREHEQDGVRTKVARGVHLDLINDEVLAQHRKVRGGGNRG